MAVSTTADDQGDAHRPSEVAPLEAEGNRFADGGNTTRRS
jgi:hypothetical protein